jgi:hypothetical protein
MKKVKGDYNYAEEQKNDYFFEETKCKINAGFDAYSSYGN